MRTIRGIILGIIVGIIPFINIVISAIYAIRIRKLKIALVLILLAIGCFIMSSLNTHQADKFNNNHARLSNKFFKNTISIRLTDSATLSALQLEDTLAAKLKITADQLIKQYGLNPLLINIQQGTLSEAEKKNFHTLALNIHSCYILERGLLATKDTLSFKNFSAANQQYISNNIQQFSNTYITEESIATGNFFSGIFITLLFLFNIIAFCICIYLYKDYYIRKDQTTNNITKEETSQPSTPATSKKTYTTTHTTRTFTSNNPAQAINMDAVNNIFDEFPAIFDNNTDQQAQQQQNVANNATSAPDTNQPVTNTTSQTKATTPLKINYADEAGLSALDGISSVQAVNIINERNTNGFFISIDDLQKRVSLSERVANNLKDKINFDIPDNSGKEGKGRVIDF